MLKIGIDVHGVLDTFPEVVKLIETLTHLDDVEIHVITGLTREDANKQIGHLLDLDTVHYFSIVDSLIADHVTITWEDGLPYAPQAVWNMAKAKYCKSNEIDFMLDDSPTYGDYFKDPSVRTVFCQVQNVDRKVYKTR